MNATREPLVGLAERLREVTQADREAAADLLDGMSEPPAAVLGFAPIREGGWDDYSVVQAFAQHRSTALEEQSRRVEAMRLALEQAPIPGYDECPRAFRERSDAWLAGPYRTALSPPDTVETI